MLAVVADTSPIRYPVEIRHIGVLPQLFGKIFIPAFAPAAVRAWANSPPGWLKVSPVTASDDPAFQSLDEGEKAALTLAGTLHADLILIDDRNGAAAARRKGFEITGTLGLLTRAAQRGLIDLTDAVARLRGTNSHFREELLDDLLKKYAGRGQEEG